MYCVWCLVVIVGVNGYGGVFWELLMKREEFNMCVGEMRKVLMGYEYFKVVEIGKICSWIDEDFMCFIKKMMVKFSCDMFLYEVY